MELQQPRLPVPAAIEHHPEARNWPTPPTTALIPNVPATDVRLPGLKAVLSPEYEHSPAYSETNHHHPHSPASVRSLPPIDVGHANAYGYHNRHSSTAVLSPMESGSAMSIDGEQSRAMSVASVEDPKEREAAEALAGLGNPDFARGQTHHMSSHASHSSSARASDASSQPEPLLELIAQAYPWVGGAIQGSLTAYSTTKYYSPRFVQYGANLVERNITVPVVSAVSSVGELTGAEHGLRRYLDSRRPEAMRKQQDANMDVEQGAMSNGDNMQIDFDPTTEILPAYRSSRPPSYREVVSPTFDQRTSRDMKERERPSNNRSWSANILITTSGLSVALSTTSRTSLRHCLRLLSQAFSHVTNLTTALSMILHQYEETRKHMRQNSDSSLEKGERPRTPDQNPAAKQLAEAIEQHSRDIWISIKYVVDAVSRSVGGALPENAREFVRQQLMSLPQRWQVASNQSTSESDTSRGAQRMIGFASEGLDMMTQVSGVIKGTLDSAEKWLERVGRRDPEEQQGMQENTGAWMYGPETEKS